MPVRVGCGCHASADAGNDGGDGRGSPADESGSSWAREADRIAFSYFEEAGFNTPPLTIRFALSHPADRAERRPRPRVGDRTERVEAGAGTGGEPTVRGPTSSFYLTDEGFRRSDYGNSRGPRDVSIRTLLDSATLSLPDTASLDVRGLPCQAGRRPASEYRCADRRVLRGGSTPVRSIAPVGHAGQPQDGDRRRHRGFIRSGF